VARKVITVQLRLRYRFSAEKVSEGTGWTPTIRSSSFGPHTAATAAMLGGRRREQTA